MNATILTTILGDANSEAVHSGYHFYFLEAAKKITAAGGLSLNYNSPATWAVRQLYSFGSLRSKWPRRGAQFNNNVLEQLWTQFKRPREDIVLLNFFQLYPKSILQDTSICKSFYIDFTVNQLLSLYGTGKGIEDNVKDEIYQRERDGYNVAKKIFVMSDFVKQSLLSDYGIASEKIRVVLPGASFSSVLIDKALQQKRMEDESTTDLKPMQIVFVGKDWHRKGLDILLQASHLLKQNGISHNVHVIGVKETKLPRNLQGYHHVVFHGMIDKRRDAERFTQLICQSDIGVLPSRADASPIAIREFQALGLPVVATNVGACSELVRQGAGETIEAPITPAQLANVLIRYASSRALLAESRKLAIDSAMRATWDFAAKQLCSELNLA